MRKTIRVVVMKKPVNLRFPPKATEVKIWAKLRIPPKLANFAPSGDMSKTS
jgi:hypothetical protein